MSLILVVSPVPTHPANAGNRVRIHNMLLALKQQGHAIHFLYTGAEQGCDLIAMRNEWDESYVIPQKQKSLLKKIIGKVKQVFNLNTTVIDRWVWSLKLPFVERLFKPYAIDDWYNNDLEPVIEQLKKRHHYHVVIVEYVFLSKVLTQFDQQCVKLLDTHDVFANRHLMYIEKGKIPHYFYTTPEQETIGLNRADTVIAIQNHELEYFRKHCKKTVVVVGHLVNARSAGQHQVSDKVQLLFVGSGSAPNIAALEFLLGDIAQHLAKRKINFQCAIVGRVSKPGQVKQGFEFVGPVDHLEGYYEQADIILNPVPIGTGLNIKSIEAIGYGKPLITTEVGAKGLNEGEGSAFLVAKTAKEFVDQIENLCESSAYYQQIADHAFQFAKQYNQQVLKNLIDLIPSN